MFFSVDELTQKKHVLFRTPPACPDTGWMTPTYYPDLTHAAVISFDTETYDPNLDKLGPGWARGKDGYIIGFSVAVIMKDGRRGKWYFPIRHRAEIEYNLDANRSLDWLNSVLNTPHIPKVGANLVYDIGWLREEGVTVSGQLFDVQTIEALLEEDATVALDALGHKYAGRGKDTGPLYEWCAQAFGGKPNSKQRANLWRTPPRLVGGYAEEDADIPLDVLAAQWPLLVAEGLDGLADMECALIPMLVEMRFCGQQVDLDRAETLHREITADIATAETAMFRKYGVHTNVYSGDDLATLFNAAGVKYPRTEAGNPSFQKKWLENLAKEHDDPLGNEINNIRELYKLRDTFLQSYVIEGNHNGKIHATFNPIRGTDGGTRTGRFASNSPNLQNIPSRSELGKKVRTCFIPDKGHVSFYKGDYSQIEYRFHVHFAVGNGADAVRARFNSDPKTDYHNLTYNMVCPYLGWDADDVTQRDKRRKGIKTINFGLLYGMGKAKLARQLGLTAEAAEELFRGYHLANPYTQETTRLFTAEAGERGFITTILGRRRRFGTWLPPSRGMSEKDRAELVPCGYNEALRLWGHNIERAYTHKATNSRYQGSAADQMKKGMLELWQSGVLNEIGCPRMTVHDELTWSRMDLSARSDEAFRYAQHVMENVIPLRIPVKFDVSEGANWAVCG